MASKVDYIVSLAVEGKEYSAAVQKASQDMDRFKKRTEGSASSLSKFAKGFGLVAGGATAAKAAYALFNKATSDSQTLADEWARQVAAAQSAYDAFVSHLTSGDLSGFFSNFDRIISKAREAADALDRLATVNIFAEGETADYMAQIFAARTKLSNKTISREERNAAKAQLDEATKNLKQIGGEQVKSYTDVFDKLMTQYLGEKGFSGDINKYSQYFTSLSGYDRAIDMAALVKDYNNKSDLYLDALFNSTDQKRIDRLKAQMDSAAQLVAGISQEERKFLVALSEISDEKLLTAIKNRIAAANIERQLPGVDRENMEVRNRADSFYNFGAVNAPNAPKGSIAYLESELKKRNEEYAQATDDVSRRTLKAFIELLKQEIAELKGEWQDVIDEEPIPLRKDFWTRKWNEEPKDDMSYALDVPQVLPEKTEEATDKMNQYASAISAVSAAFGSLSGAAGEASDGFSATLGIMQSLLSGVSAVVAAYSALTVAKAAASGVGVASIAMAAAVGSALIGIISAVKNSAGKFAQGGIVGGTSYTGDRLSANVNSGEMILNQAQQRNLLALATYGGGSGEASEGYVRGDTIYMSLHNFMKRTGKRL